MALRRLQNLEKRLENMPEVAQAYKENIKREIENNLILATFCCSKNR